MSTSGDKCNAASDHSKFMVSHLILLEEFLQFCNNKKGKLDPNAEPSGGISFKEKVVKYFGECLPSDVFYELCKLVAENSYGKCHYCMLPTESLVLSVLQILSDGNCLIKSPSLSANIDNNLSTRNNVSVLRGSVVQIAERSVGKGSDENICTKDHPQAGAGFRFQHIGEDTIFSV